MAGAIEVLNVGLGDLKLKVETEADQAAAQKMVEKLLADGYALVVTDPDGVARRVEAYDAEFHEYVIAGLPPERRPAQVRRESAATAQEAGPKPPRATWYKRGAWAGLKLAGDDFRTPRALRHSEAQRWVADVNEGGINPSEAYDAIVAENRKPARKAHATAIGPTAGG